MKGELYSHAKTIRARGMHGSARHSLRPLPAMILAACLPGCYETVWVSPANMETNPFAQVDAENDCWRPLIEEFENQQYDREQAGEIITEKDRARLWKERRESVYPVFEQCMIDKGWTRERRDKYIGMT